VSAKSKLLLDTRPTHPHPVRRSHVDLERGIFYRKPIGKRVTKKRQTPAPTPLEKRTLAPYLRDLGLTMPLGIARICGEVGDLADLIRDDGPTGYPLGLLCHLRPR
jgi:hypothetical protein